MSGTGARCYGSEVAGALSAVGGSNVGAKLLVASSVGGTGVSVTGGGVCVADGAGVEVAVGGAGVCVAGGSVFAGAGVFVSSGSGVLVSSGTGVRVGVSGVTVAIASAFCAFGGAGEGVGGSLAYALGACSKLECCTQSNQR